MGQAYDGLRPKTPATQPILAPERVLLLSTVVRCSPLSTTST